MDARIAVAFADDARSDSVSGLLAEVEAAASAAEADSEAARARALDPLVSSDGAVVARREMDDAAFKRDRLREAARKLSERVAAVRALEADRHAHAEHERVLTEKNRLVGEMERMSEPVAQISRLVSEIDLFDREIKSFNLTPKRIGYIRPILSGGSSFLEILFHGWPRGK
jgi:hypothetical protein